MSDFDLLIALQKELAAILDKRARIINDWVPRTLSKAKIHRLRLQIQEVMLRIENTCEGSYIQGKEVWHR